MSKTHLEVKNLVKTFKLGAGIFSSSNEKIYAVNNVSFKLEKGEILGIVGESGSGKSTTAKTIVQAYKKDSGEIIFYNKQGEKIVIDKYNKKKSKFINSKIKYVFQDPVSSLDPRLTVLEILTVGLKYSQKSLSKKELYERACYIIKKIGLSEEALHRKPMDFSGGQRQRISLARALMFEPEILICDEVVSALDVSIQSQILNLLVDLKKQFNLSIIFIAHDLSVISYLCDKIIVMYGGQIVENCKGGNIFKDAKHPYTKLLANSIPSPETNFETFNYDGKMINPLKKSKLCPFLERCQEKTEECKKTFPPQKEAEKSTYFCYK